MSFETLRARWEAFTGALDARWLPGGVTFHGDRGHRRWVASVRDPRTGVAGPEGWGDNPMEALLALEAVVSEGLRGSDPESPTFPNSAEVDALAARWKQFGRTLPDRWLPGGVTFEGGTGSHSWAAFVIESDTWQAGPSMHASDPIQAIEALRERLDKA